ncbi:hypothetical protein [Saccharolobus sp. E5-1-F]|uniref:hypothetical protein n=1 Tax=Saccharolobus sp. E5-1-F TaxID=2663019 RepID=UPI001EE7DE1C|nr:hypothetical protein [Sulfolobus sp. E5-1-F]
MNWKKFDELAYNNCSCTKNGIVCYDDIEIDIDDVELSDEDLEKIAYQYTDELIQILVREIQR